MLAAESIDKGFAGTPVLQDCSIKIDPGACVVIRGRSGSGKTTLLRCLSLLERPDKGTIVHDRARHEFSRPGNASRTLPDPFPFLTIVFQQLHLWPNLTVAQNITLATQRDIARKLSPAEVQVLQELSVESLVTKRPSECSHGQRQRIAIARALLTQAKYILMDEPTSALDRANRRVVVDMLKRAREQKRGMLIISHDEREFESVTDTLLELEGGRLSEIT